ncbi:MAG: hypothetical protein OXC71_07125 [Chloroflexi bacterium]|nr:hypothetical protein [Chloroflexota bacterium]
MADLRPEGIHILAADGTVLRANLKDRTAGRRVARRLTNAGEPVTLAEAGTDYRRLYIDGSQDGRRPRRSLSDGADRASDSAGSLATGNRLEVTDLVDELGDRERAVPAGEFDARSPDAKRPGIDAWWADEEACRLIGETLGADPNPGQPIYIGQTEGTFVERVLSNHINGNGRSTFRVTLAAIMMTVGSFAAEHPDPRSSWRSSRLSDWIQEHLAVSIVAVDVRELNVAEREAFARYDPPLNLRGLPKTPAREKLKRLRKLVDPRRK